MRRRRDGEEMISFMELDGTVQYICLSVFFISLVVGLAWALESFDDD